MTNRCWLPGGCDRRDKCDAEGLCTYTGTSFRDSWIQPWSSVFGRDWFKRTPVGGGDGGTYELVPVYRHEILFVLAKITDLQDKVMTMEKKMEKQETGVDNGMYRESGIGADEHDVLPLPSIEDIARENARLGRRMIDEVGKPPDDRPRPTLDWMAN